METRSHCLKVTPKGSRLDSPMGWDLLTVRPTPKRLVRLSHFLRATRLDSQTVKRWASLRHFQRAKRWGWPTVTRSEKRTRCLTARQKARRWDYPTVKHSHCRSARRSGRR